MIQLDGDTMEIHGNLTIATVPEIFATGLKQLSRENMRVDFSGVEQVDSAAVSMLMGWQRAAGRHGHGLSVFGLPDDLQSLAQLYGVVEMLPQQSHDPFGSVERPETPAKGISNGHP